MSYRMSASDDLVRDAPDILALSDREKFCDDEGNIYGIETRGDWTTNIYFRASDIIYMLDMDNINSFMRDNEFIQGEDFEEFNILTERFPCLFLTYLGLMRILFVHKHPNAKNFRNWVTKTLFTIKYGTSDAKTAIVAAADTEADTEAMPVIYLFIIGRIGDLRDEMKIDKKHTFEDDGMVAKFGYTNDLKRRATEHANAFGKFKGTNIYLRCYTRIDPANLRKAERELHRFFEMEECLVTDNKSYEELVVLNKKYVKSTVFDKFASIGMIYEGCYSDTKMLKLKLDHLNNKLAEKDAMIAEKERIIAEKERVIAEKDKTYAMMSAYMTKKR